MCSESAMESSSRYLLFLRSSLSFRALWVADGTLAALLSLESATASLLFILSCWMQASLRERAAISFLLGIVIAVWCLVVETATDLDLYLVSLVEVEGDGLAEVGT